MENATEATWLLWRQRLQKVSFLLSTLKLLVVVFNFIHPGENFQKVPFPPKTRLQFKQVTKPEKKCFVLKFIQITVDESLVVKTKNKQTLVSSSTYKWANSIYLSSYFTRCPEPTPYIVAVYVRLVLYII